MKAGLVIDILNANYYKKTKFLEFQWMISKLMYLVCGTKLHIAFVVSNSIYMMQT